VIKSCMIRTCHEELLGLSLFERINLREYRHHGQVFVISALNLRDTLPSKREVLQYLTDNWLHK
jgi:hypothetical protein